MVSALEVSRPPGYAQAFARALLDPDQPVPEGLAGPHGKRAGKRFDVYRNNVTVSLIDALAEIYPATQRIVGETFFRAMARLHVRASPPRSPLLFEYGRGFPDFIDSFEHTASMPWLGDVARIERAWLDAYHAADRAPLDRARLSSVDPAELGALRFCAHPAARILRSRFPAVTIFTANRKEGPVESLEASQPEDALITRPDLDVTVRWLPPGGAAFLLSLAEGRTLGEAAEAGMEASEVFDLPANIRGMLEAGVFSSSHRMRSSEVEGRGYEGGKR